jgi:hypothetical protein
VIGGLFRRRLQRRQLGLFRRHLQSELLEVATVYRQSRRPILIVTGQKLDQRPPEQGMLHRPTFENDPAGKGQRLHVGVGGEGIDASRHPPERAARGAHELTETLDCSRLGGEQ